MAMIVSFPLMAPEPKPSPPFKPALGCRTRQNLVWVAAYG